MYLGISTCTIFLRKDSVYKSYTACVICAVGHKDFGSGFLLFFPSLVSRTIKRGRMRRGSLLPRYGGTVGYSEQYDG